MGKYRFTNHGKNKFSFTLHAKQKCPFTRHEKSIGDPLMKPLLDSSLFLARRHGKAEKPAEKGPILRHLKIHRKSRTIATTTRRFKLRWKKIRGLVELHFNERGQSNLTLLSILATLILTLDSICKLSRIHGFSSLFFLSKTHSSFRFCSSERSKDTNDDNWRLTQQSVL